MNGQQKSAIGLFNVIKTTLIDNKIKKTIPLVENTKRQKSKKYHKNTNLFTKFDIINGNYFLM